MKTIPSFVACVPALLLANLTLLAQSPPPDGAVRAGSDPYVRGGAGTAAVETPSTPKIVSICFETFSLDLADAASLRRRKLSDKELYAEIIGRVAKGQAKQETFAVARAQSGMRGLLENISEQLFPTAYDHTAEPKDESQSEAKPEAAPASPPVQTSQPGPALPIDLETRNVGFNMEIEPTIGENDQVVDLRITPEFVTLADHVSWGQGVSKSDFPVFETQRFHSATTLISGQAQLLGTFSRPPVSKVDADSAHRTWFAFVTADVVPVVKE